MVNFEENYHLSRFQRGSNIFQGGVQIFPRVSNCLYPIETHITCAFPGGPDPLTPSGSALAISINRDSFDGPYSGVRRPHVRIQRGVRVSGPPSPWKITSYMGFFGHPHPLGEVGPLLPSVIKPLDPLCKL